MTSSLRSPRWLSDEEQELWRLMLAARRKIDRVLNETLIKGQGLSTSEFSVLVTLSEAPEHELRLRDLCCELDWDRSRTSHQVTRMEKRGLVRKGRSEGDLRGVIVSITEDGMNRLRAAAPEHVESVKRLVFDHLSPAEEVALTSFFQNVLAVGNVPGTPGFDAEHETLCEALREGA